MNTNNSKNDKEAPTTPMVEEWTSLSPTAGDFEAPSPAIQEEEPTDFHDSSSCLICYEDFVETEQQQRPTTIYSCRHVFCRTCLQQHVQHAVMEQRLVPVPCPCRTSVGGASCQGHLTPTQVESLLEEEDDDDNNNNNTTNSNALKRTWRLYQRLGRLQADPTLMPCPWCDALVAPSPKKEDNDDDKSTGMSSCPSCLQAFCTIHGSAHPGQSCAQYLAKNNHSTTTTTTITRDLDTERVLQQHTKPCSHCGGRIQKEAGCNHVVCPACRHDMCYRCGTHEHLTGKVIRTCGRCSTSYLDHRHDVAYKCRTILCLPLLVPTFGVYVILMAVLAVITGGFGCCFGCGRCLAMPSTNDKIDDNDDEEQPTQQSSWERAVRFGLSVVALPWIVTLRDLGIAQHVRLPHEIYHNLPAGAQDRNASALPEIPTMHVFGSDSSNIEAPLTGGASEGDEDIESGSEC